MWIKLDPANLPPYNTLILVRDDWGGVKLTMFKGMLSDEKGIKYIFNRNSCPFMETPMGCGSSDTPTHYMVVPQGQGFEISLQPTDKLD